MSQYAEWPPRRSSGGSGGGGAIVESNSYSSPSSLAGSANIPAPTNQREKIYIKGSGGAVTGITISAGTGTYEFFIVGTDNTNTAQLVSSANVQLSGTWVARQGSVMSLQWTAGLAKWLEVSRNEI